MKVLSRYDKQIKVGCDVLFDDSCRKQIRFDDDGNEYVNLPRGFTLSACDIDEEYTNLHERRVMLRDILRKDDDDAGSFDYLQNLIMEDTVDGVRFMPTDKYLPREQFDYRAEEWEPTVQEEEETVRFVVRDIDWGGVSGLPENVQIDINPDVLDTDEEIDEVERLVKEEIERKYPMIYDLDNIFIQGYSLAEAPTGYDFDPNDEIGFNGI